jgi:hypothetical protein
MTRSYQLVASVLLVSSVVACGSSDGGGGSGGNGASAGSATGGSSSGGSSSTGGSNATGGFTTTGGNSSSTGGDNSKGGMSGGTAGSGSTTAGHCTPGTPQPPINFLGDVLNSCSSVSGVTGEVNNILDIALSKPVGPGQTFAFSVDLKAPEGDFEMYGANRECGDVGELLSTIHVTGNGIICHEVKPVTGTYSHMIWVWRVAAEMKNTAICESGTCPAH